MKKQFVNYTQQEINSDINSDNVQNILVEMLARCLAGGERIIIEQGEKRGDKYIMVDFMPTDGTCNAGGYEYDGRHICYISSCDGENEGKYFSEHANYFDALNEAARIIREDGFTEMYVETY